MLYLKLVLLYNFNNCKKFFINKKHFVSQNLKNLLSGGSRIKIHLK